MQNMCLCRIVSLKIGLRQHSRKKRKKSADNFRPRHILGILTWLFAQFLKPSFKKPTSPEKIKLNIIVLYKTDLIFLDSIKLQYIKGIPGLYC